MKKNGYFIVLSIFALVVCCGDASAASYGTGMQTPWFKGRFGSFGLDYLVRVGSSVASDATISGVERLLKSYNASKVVSLSWTVQGRGKEGTAYIYVNGNSSYGRISGRIVVNRGYFKGKWGRRNSFSGTIKTRISATGNLATFGFISTSWTVTETFMYINPKAMRRIVSASSYSDYFDDDRRLNWYGR